MTDSTTQDTTSAPTTDAEQTDAPQVDETTQEPQEGTERGNREAAKYRRALRETEAERDALTARVETLQRDAIETIVADILHRPAALWATGTTLTDLLDADGNIEQEKVTQAAVRAREELGAAPIRGPYSPREGAVRETGKNSTAWENAFAREVE